MIDCYIALGSNLGTASRQIRLAITRLGNLPQSQIIEVAPFYQNLAVGLKNQPGFINTVVYIQTRLPPLALLTHCQAIEKRLGRVRKRKWGARTIDIDLILYGDRKIKHPKLNIPHPRFMERDFVMVPLSHLRSSHTYVNKTKQQSVHSRI